MKVWFATLLLLNVLDIATTTPLYEAAACAWAIASPVPKVDKSFLRNFLENMEERFHIFLSRTISKDEVIGIEIELWIPLLKRLLNYYPWITQWLGKSNHFRRLLWKAWTRFRLPTFCLGTKHHILRSARHGKDQKGQSFDWKILWENGYSLQTGNAEWTVYDVVGGPTMKNRFKPGFLSLAVKKCKEKLEEKKDSYWLILDELNRANLDLGFGKIFTLLDLDYRVDACMLRFS